jgi:hydrogenase maturation protein HypF
MTATLPAEDLQTLEIRVRGRVQGVGFRPTVWRLARELGLAGEVLNDGEGVLVRVRANPAGVESLISRLESEPPPLARVDVIERRRYDGALPREFKIADSAGGSAHTQIAPDATICAACAAELRDRSQRRYRYAFTNCTHCGPRLSILTALPYDRATTTMAAFPLCDQCLGEYRAPSDRRFHAEAIACPACGPTVRLEMLGGQPVASGDNGDDVERAAKLILDGAIVAVKGLGGYHLACDATDAGAVARLRQAKRRDRKPFALMARDLDVIRRYGALSFEEQRALTSVQAPIVLLQAKGARLPEAVAPGLDTLGFMLPTTPLHLLLLQDIGVPLVMTSGNLSDAPAIIDDPEMRRCLPGVAAAVLVHDRVIANRVDDSVVRVMGGRSRVLRRARGFAPAPISLPAGFERAPDLLAMGGELKATFCLVKDGEAVLSQHQGDLENASTFDDYRKNLSLYTRMFDHAPEAVAIDRHPEYLSSKHGRREVERTGRPLVEIQHHHAHVAACLAENGRPLDAAPVLGVVLDGLGFGDDGTIWGGEFLLADYYGYERLAFLKPVAMPGGTQAVREPWRNLHAQIEAAAEFDPAVDLSGGFARHVMWDGKPLSVLERMIAKRVNAPLASSCGRLFDAAAAALGLCFDRQAYEGEAAARLETLARQAHEDDIGYQLALVETGPQRLTIDPAPLWYAMLVDLDCGVSRAVIALRFHLGLAAAIVGTVSRLAGDRSHPFDTVALSGGCFQNRLLFEAVVDGLTRQGFAVHSHAETPANDGGLALGQAAIAAAQLIARDKSNARKDPACASAFLDASSA